MTIDVQGLITSAKADGRRTLESADGRFLLVAEYPAVSVYETARIGAAHGGLVAHSSMRADFEASVDEFVGDYLEAL